MTLLLQDGKRSGHLLWCREALRSQHVGGVILNTFCTPAVGRERNPAAQEVVENLRGVKPGVLILLDPTTHGALLPGTDSWVNFSSWQELWPQGTVTLDGPARIAEHVNSVFSSQRRLGLPTLAPTVQIDRPGGPQAALALAVANEARRQDPQCTQALVGTRALWSAGPDLDALVGSLAQLRAPRWLITPMRDQVGYPPDLSDYEATAGFLRTTTSLARRSDVIAAHSDWTGLGALAAGASAIGTGWDQGQRACSAGSFRETSGGSYRSYSPHPGLLARFSQDVAEALQDAASEFALSMRNGQPIPANETDHRSQHFEGLGSVVSEILAAGAKPDLRSRHLRHFLGRVQMSWKHALSLGVAGIGNAEYSAWFGNLNAGFERYFRAERF